MKEQLLSKIQDCSAVVALVGLGYVGLPLAVAFAEKGFSVRGIDVDQTKVDRLNRSDSYVQDIPSQRLAPLVASGKFRATTSFAALDDCDAAVIAVPTQLKKTCDSDVRYHWRARPVPDAGPMRRRYRGWRGRWQRGWRGEVEPSG